MDSPLEELLRGNERALAAERARPPGGPRRPTAAILACTDERVVPQVVFDHPPGKLYMVRMAGNVFSHEVAGSLEVAVFRLGCPLVVVLGHTDCTAVHLAHARERVEGSIYDITRRIWTGIQHLPREAPLVEAVEANVRFTLREIRERCRPLREAEEAGRVALAGAIYDLETGRIRVV